MRTACDPDCGSIISPYECPNHQPASHRRTTPAPTSRPIVPATVHTYVIGAEGSPLVKIGRTTGRPEQRLAALQTGQPSTLSLLWHCEGDHETALHRKFAAHRVRGEWFDLTPLGDPAEVVRAATDSTT